MRPLKIAGIVIGSLLGLVVLGVVALLLLFDPNAYRGDLERLVQQKAGRPLHINGKLDLKLFPWLAISTGEITLGNPPGYGSEPFLTVRQASVGVRLLPLLHKRLEVSRLAVDGFTAHLISRSDSDNNWRDLTESRNPSPPPDSGAAPPQGSIAGVDIKNSSLTLTDEARKSVTEISNFELHTGAIDGSSPVAIRLEFDYGDAAKKAATHIAVASRAVKLDTKAGTLAPTDLDVKFGDLALQLSATGEHLFTNRLLTGKLTLAALSPRKLLDSFGIAPPVTRDPKALSALSVQSDYRLTQKQLRLSNLVLTLDDTHVRGEAGVDDLDTMALSYDLKVDAINADRYLAPVPKEAPPKPAAGPGASKPPTRLPVEALRKLNVRGSLQVGTATLSGLVLTGVSLPLAANDGRIHLGPTQAHLFGGTYNGDVVLDARPTQAQVALNEHLKGVDVGAVAKATLDTKRLSGHGDANAVLTGVGNTDQDILRSLAGKIDVNVKEGAITGIDLWYELRRAQAVIKRTAIPARTGPEQTAFNKLSGSATLDKGIARNDDLSVETDYLKAHGKGTLDLGSKAIDYQVVAAIYQLPAQGAGSELTDLKSTEIPFTIKGSLDHMTVRPDLEALAKSQLRQKLGDKLKSLFGR